MKGVDYMELSKLIDRCNRGKIASDYLRAPEIYYYMDDVILDLNERLQANFPLVSLYNEFVADWNVKYPETPLVNTNYNVVPDMILSRVMPVGVARYFFMKDEEGEVVASDYFREYERALAATVRDYIDRVPTVFRNEEGGFITSTYDDETTSDNDLRGMVIDGYEYRI